MAEKGYTLAEKQAVLRDSKRRMEPVHQHWTILEALYRTGAQRELTAVDLNRILPFQVPGAFLRTVNMVLPHLSMIINTVSARDPKMIVTPIGGDPAVIERNGEIAKNVLEYFMRRCDAVEVLHDMTQDAVILGNSFCKVSWAYSETTSNKTPDEAAQELSNLIESAQEIAAESGTPLTDQTLADIVESVSLSQQLVDIDEPFVEYVSPYDIFVPANARRMNKVRWVAQRLRLPVEDLKANPLFDKKAAEEIKADTMYADEVTRQKLEDTDQSLPEAFSNATVYEFYDMKYRTLTIFQIDSETPLYDGPIPYVHRYPPFVHMRNFNDGGDTFWSFGDLENIAGIQLMVNEIMVAEINDLKRVGNKYFINKKVLTPDITEALRKNTPDMVIPIDVPNSTPMSEILIPVQRLATPSDNYVMEGKLQDYMQRILGISDFQAGQIASSSRVPATAAAAVEGASTTRSLDKQTNVEKTAREIGIRILALCQQFLDNEKAIRIAGPDAPQWLRVTAEDIEGEFSIETEGGSTQAINPATRAKQGMEMLTSVIPALAQLGYDPTNALRTAFTYMGLNPDHLLVKAQPTPQPQAPGAAAPQGDPNAQMPPQGGGMDPNIMAQLSAMGGPPVPAGMDGQVAL